MSSLRRRFACYLVCAVVSTSIWPALASERAFPFDRELMLEAAPMPGSKRVPIIEVDKNGAASIDLWCAGRTVRPMSARIRSPSLPARSSRRSARRIARAATRILLAALAQMTNWSRSGDVIELSGATTLRFRLMTN